MEGRIRFHPEKKVLKVFRGEKLVEERIYWLGWQLLMPGSSRRLWSLVEYFGSPRVAWEAGVKDLAGAPGIGDEGPEGLARRRAAVDPVKEAEKLASMGVAPICYSDQSYPPNLLEIHDYPPVLFLLGKLASADKLAIAMVGSRKPTTYGLAVAEKIAKDLAAVGVTVVSGMARGIDTAVHRGALASGGRTIAVLGCGPDIVYPRENQKLMSNIINEGAVISEFPPGTPPEPWRFPVRNRIISGLSLGTVVVEAAEKSGALITADFALEQGRDVMAVPGNVVSSQSRGPHRLIKQGARLVEGAGDILDEMGLEKLFPLQASGDGSGLKMSIEEESLYKLLTIEPAAIDDLIAKSGLPTQKALAALMYLEVKGLTRQLPGKYYIRTGRNLF